jgi:hypothetical protein
MSNPNEEYLGDGVYAVWDGWTITLDLRAQDDTTRIALEPEVIDSLMRFRNRVYAEANAKKRP